MPECPDYFFWNGWYYLVFSNRGVARYRMSRGPFGPWLRPQVDALDGAAARVMKTAPFGESRRLGVAWIGTSENNRDDGPFQWGGNAVFRELIQHDDGTLGAKFPDELTPGGEPLSVLQLSALDADTRVDGRRTLIDRCPEQRGDRMLLYAQDSEVAFEVAEIAALP